LTVMVTVRDELRRLPVFMDDAPSIARTIDWLALGTTRRVNFLTKKRLKSALLNKWY